MALHVVDDDPMAITHVPRRFDKSEGFLPGDMAHAKSQVVRLTALDNFVAQRNQLSFVIKEVIVGIIELRMTLIIGFEAVAKAFAFHIVARAPRRKKNHFAAKLSAGFDDAWV